jgi:hypothetical protein
VKVLVSVVGPYPLVCPEGVRYERGPAAEVEMTPWLVGQVEAGALKVEEPEGPDLAADEAAAAAKAADEAAAAVKAAAAKGKK